MRMRDRGCGRHVLHTGSGLNLLCKTRRDTKTGAVTNIGCAEIRKEDLIVSKELVFPAIRRRLQEKHGRPQTTTGHP